jgi:hypothetical protein
MSYRVVILFLVFLMLGPAASREAAAQTTYAAPKPRRHFVTISTDWLHTLPLHFAEHPLQDLVGRPVSATPLEQYDYRTRDEAILIDVVEFRRRGRGGGITVYPLGASVGSTLAIRAGIEDLPVIRIDFAGPGAPASYSLSGVRAYDFSAGIFMADRSAGWGLGSHAFVGGGVGRLKGENISGKRYFAEGGGGLTSGPFGIELSVKFAWNQLPAPVDHRFLTVPITLRGTLTF